MINKINIKSFNNVAIFLFIISIIVLFIIIITTLKNRNNTIKRNTKVTIIDSNNINRNFNPQSVFIGNNPNDGGIIVGGGSSKCFDCENTMINKCGEKGIYLASKQKCFDC